MFGIARVVERMPVATKLEVEELREIHCLVLPLVASIQEQSRAQLGWLVQSPETRQPIVARVRESCSSSELLVSTAE